MTGPDQAALLACTCEVQNDLATLHNGRCALYQQAALLANDATRQMVEYAQAVHAAQPELTPEVVWHSAARVFQIVPEPSPKHRRWHVSLRFAWYDLWIGAYVDRPNRTLYVCPLPCVLVTVRR